jgi:hypothetical protein
MTSFGAWAWQLFKNKQHLPGSWLSELGQEAADKEYTRHIYLEKAAVKESNY